MIHSDTIQEDKLEEHLLKDLSTIQTIHMMLTPGTLVLLWNMMIKLIQKILKDNHENLADLHSNLILEFTFFSYQNIK
jgi:hypothetical protein